MCNIECFFKLKFLSIVLIDSGALFSKLLYYLSFWDMKMRISETNLFIFLTMV